MKLEKMEELVEELRIENNALRWLIGVKDFVESNKIMFYINSKISQVTNISEILSKEATNTMSKLLINDIELEIKQCKNRIKKLEE